MGTLTLCKRTESPLCHVTFQTKYRALSSTALFQQILIQYNDGVLLLPSACGFSKMCDCPTSAILAALETSADCVNILPIAPCQRGLATASSSAGCHGGKRSFISQ